jgi:hypothetical protein
MCNWWIGTLDDWEDAGVAVRVGCDNDDRAAMTSDVKGRDGGSWEPSMTTFSVATSDCSAII